MHKCFVIQPFDGGKFDKRYDDTFSPAIRAAGLEPYRVDHDPSATIPIEEIESGIESCHACLADITTDNPNVWFELGFAIARGRKVVLICCDDRESPFPFDVQHRAVIKYAADSSSDFEKLKERITARLNAVPRGERQVEQVAGMSSMATVGGLEQHELATLVVAARFRDGPTDGISAHEVRRGMKSAGYTSITTAVGLHTLVEIGLLATLDETPDEGRSFTTYRVTALGMDWLVTNKDRLRMTIEAPVPPAEEEIPF